MRALLLVALCACRASGTFACERDDQCNGAGSLGTCELAGFCAFPDASCASGKRYDPYAGDGLADVCVGDEPMGDARVDTPDGQLPGPLHLAAADGVAGTGDFVLGDAVIDTTALTVSVALPAGVTFDHRPQLGGGPELAVLHVHALTISGTATVTGSRPFVIVASAGVMIDGVLDASAHANVAGPGAAVGGAGGDGAHLATVSDSGGGGGGYATAGGAGGAITGSCTVTAGTAGALQGDAAIAALAGGSPGGRGSGSACPLNPGGGGGGAVQISAMSIVVNSSGHILAGGGGGSGGTDCGPADGNSGAGGGSGGAIVLQAPSITNNGVIAANGGGGGGSGTGSGGSGTAGQDALASTTAAMGGIGVGASGIGGGAGASASAAAQPGVTNSCTNNAGGGGGAAGRIAVSTGYVDSGVTSPSPSASLPL